MRDRLYTWSRKITKQAKTNTYDNETHGQGNPRVAAIHYIKSTVFNKTVLTFTEANCGPCAGKEKASDVGASPEHSKTFISECSGMVPQPCQETKERHNELRMSVKEDQKITNEKSR